MIGQKDKESKLKAIIQDYRPEINFVLIFVVGVVVCFLLVKNETVSETVIKPITVVETIIASKILTVIGYDNKQEERYISGVGDNRFHMEVKNNCNGVYESIVFLMAFIAIQIPWRRKIGWMTFGFALFHLINEMRLVTLFIVGSNYSHDTFVFFHETFWNYALVILTLGIFIFCAHQVSKAPKVPPSGSPTQPELSAG